jgi:SAM-dependent methyltransferase
MTARPIVCPVCGCEDCEDCGPPAYRRPTTVAGMPIYLDDLHLLHARCPRCTYRFVFPPIPEQRLLDAYSRAAEVRWTVSDAAVEGRQYGYKAQLLARHAPGKRVVDFGCFDGSFLAYLGDGYERFGIEPSQWAAEHASKRGIQIIGPTIDSVPPEFFGTFDAAVIFDVLEHLVNPVGVLVALRRLLKPGGVILAETGNTDSYPWRKQGRLYQYCSFVEHVGFFNRESVRQAAARAGLDLIHFEESVHSTWPLRLHFLWRGYNVLYRILRLADRARLPLPGKLAAVARGAFPRPGNPKDHFIAVLKTPVVGGS